MNRLLPYITAIVVLLVIALGIPKVLNTERYRQQIADSLTQKLDHKVIVGKVDYGFFPPTLKLHNVSLLNPTGDTPLLQIEQINAPLNWAALFHAALVPQSLTFQGWFATIHRKADGSWDRDEWFGPATQLNAKSNWPLTAVNFDHGELHAVDPYGPNHEEFVVQVLEAQWVRDRQYISANGVFTSLPAPVTFLFQGSGQFISNPQWSGVLELQDETRDWKLDCKVADDQATLSGQTAEWRFDTAYAFLRFYSRLPVAPPVTSPTTLLQQWNTQVSLKGNTLTVTQNATLAQGKAEAKGQIVFNSNASQARVDLALEGSQIQSLETVFWGNAPLEGTVTGLAHLEVALSSSPWSTVSGQGAFELKSGLYYWPKESADAVSRAHMMKYMLKKYPGFLQTGMPLVRVAARWQASQGVFSFDNGYCSLGDVQAGWVGKYDAAHEGVDAYVRVQVHERDKELLKDIPPAYVYGTQIQPMHGHIQGTPGEWHLRAYRYSKVPAGVMRKLIQAIKGK